MLRDTNVTNLVMGLLITYSFVFLDGLALLALPRLRISYGGDRLPFFSLSFLRGIIFIFWFIILRAILINHPFAKQQVDSQPYPLFQTPVLLLFATNILLLAFVIYIFFIGPTQISVTHIRVIDPNLNQPVRIVQLSDIHVERTSLRELALPGLVSSLHPDMILMTGDYLNESYKRSQASQQDLRDLIAQLHAPLGIYAVNGNVESRLNMDDLLKGLDIHLIDNEVIKIPQLGDHFVLLGLEYNVWYEDEVVLKNLMSTISPDDFTILLYHKSDLAYTAQDLGINLYLTGHTHGGQFRLPFYGALITDSRYNKKFEKGLYILGNTTMYVSAGLGMAGGVAPRIRFLCPPEVVVIDLVPSK